ncbi:hypothetical protein SAMD00019534_107730 [Acytostelium subglobosum LB1]|uniref:hypothetical protein n=1 Tax=Acytostelium subglobosum LB1 TaxID=1410327 RepID=UPI0006450F25|nr:hypothetical protein SAMD00019534_107730 [Acytostelium subglobosum LB1]GAM27597.1 hypothetical protein SAMD00019534_107730 [Acytostelium subglobosum LB1]|eukprot:XP_012749256.1 hypothetical protein SAMD00019534_107730 [Acytostelium subglobosum LB1]
MNYTLVEFDEETKFVSSSVQYVHSVIKNALTERGIAIIGLSGGTSPKPIYAQLTTVPAASEIDWKNVYFFCVDERYIEKTSADSLYHLVANTIFNTEAMRALIADHFICPDTSLPLDQCIKGYGQALQTIFARGSGHADLVTLGMGEDGHIASIFPTTDDQPAAPSDIVYHTTTTRFAVFDRITTNINNLKESSAKLFFMKGANKKVVWDEMIAAPENTRRWPAQAIVKSGNTFVYYQK